MYLIPVVALIVGFLLGLIFNFRMEPWIIGYLGVGVLGGLDTVVGGVRSQLEGRFDSLIFVTGFVANVLLGCLLVYLGDKLNLTLSLVVVLAFGMRLFTNLSLIRRILITKWRDSREQARLEAERRKQSAAAEAPRGA